MRRLEGPDGSILPCLECVPGTALLVIPLTTQNRSPNAGNLLALHPHSGNLMHATDTILPRQPNQMIVTVYKIPTVEDNISWYSGFPLNIWVTAAR